MLKPKVKTLKATTLSLRNGKLKISGTTLSFDTLLHLGYDGQRLFWGMCMDLTISVPEHT